MLVQLVHQIVAGITRSDELHYHHLWRKSLRRRPSTFDQATGTCVLPTLPPIHPDRRWRQPWPPRQRTTGNRATVLLFALSLLALTGSPTYQPLSIVPELFSSGGALAKYAFDVALSGISV
jgi:hypothetical protein